MHTQAIMPKLEVDACWHPWKAHAWVESVGGPDIHELCKKKVEGVFCRFFCLLQNLSENMPKHKARFHVNLSRLPTEASHDITEKPSPNSYYDRSPCGSQNVTAVADSLAVVSFPRVFIHQRSLLSERSFPQGH